MDDVDAIRHARRRHSRRSREDPADAGRRSTGTRDRIAARDVADAGDVPRGWRPSRRAAGSTRRPQHRGPRRARLNAADGENTSKRIKRTREGCPQEKRTCAVRRRAASLRGASRRRTRGDAMRARRGANFATNAVPFFAFMVGGSYGISVLLQVRDREAWMRVFHALFECLHAR